MNNNTNTGSLRFFVGFHKARKTPSSNC